MTLEQLKEILDAEAVGGSFAANILTASASDLLSEVLAFTPPGSLLLTGLASAQAVRTGDLVEVAAICFVRGVRPDAEAVVMAQKLRIPLLCTRLSMFEACGRLYEHGVRSDKT